MVSEYGPRIKYTGWNGSINIYSIMLCTVKWETFTTKHLAVLPLV